MAERTEVDSFAIECLFCGVGGEMQILKLSPAAADQQRESRAFELKEPKGWRVSSSLNRSGRRVFTVICADCCRKQKEQGER